MWVIAHVCFTANARRYAETLLEETK